MSFLRVAVACFIAFSAACATGKILDEDASTDGGGGTDATLDGSGCPQFDLLTDPKHCGTCTHACASGEVCSAGQCKSQCDPSLQKCVVDSGTICVDTKSDINHCGQCTTQCTTADAGGLQPGPNNPDAGISFDGGYDGGIGWSLGTPSCDASTCAIVCPQGMVECSDGICYDPQNFHDHCGSCNTACQSTEWCTQGHCCSQGSAYCNGACTDVSGDKNNCGSCGNVCPQNAPVCSGGTCVSSQIYSQSFTQSVVATAQCTAWNTYRASLTGTYSSITLSGSNDTTGRTCTGSAANTLCQALHNGTTTNVTCGGFTWYVDNCSSQGIELTADNAQCSCTNPGYNVRPCINTNGDWGGIKGVTCSAPSQTITVTCQ